MKKIIISAESTCDLPKDLVNEHNIEIAPLHINLDGKNYRDGIDITPDLIFEKYESKKVLPATSAPNVADFLEIFNKYPKDEYDIIHFSIGQGLSSSYQNAVLAASDLENVHVFDSGNLSTGFGYMVLEAAEMAEANKSVEEILERVAYIKENMNSSFLIENLTFLREGGRCTSLAAISANLLSIRPCIEVSNEDGTMKVGKKYRGNMEHALLKYAHERLSNLENIDSKRIFITHSKLFDLDISSIKDYIKSLNYFDEIIETEAGCSITTHCGANTLGVLFLEKGKN